MQLGSSSNGVSSAKLVCINAEDVVLGKGVRRAQGLHCQSGCFVSALHGEVTEEMHRDVAP